MRHGAAIAAAALALSAFVVGGAVLLRKHRVERSSEPTVPEFSLRDQRGEPVSPATLAGEPFVADFIFTQCRSTCPLQTAKMVQLERRLAGAPVRFVSFSVDPAHDTPEVLRAYAAAWAPEERRWLLVATDKATLDRLLAAFGAAATPTSDPNDPIVHTTTFALVDAAGRIRGAWDSEEPGQLAALEASARSLVGGGPAAAPLPGDGAGLYHALSCVSCHERPDLAPPLADLAGRRRELESGLAVTADEAYVRESIVAPDAKRVRGYPLRMPTYDGLLDDARLGALARWILARRAEPGAAEEGARVEVDPVCGMKVRVAPDAPAATVRGRTLHFCSTICRDRYAAHPEAFSAPPAP